MRMLELYPNNAVSEPSTVKIALTAAEWGCWGSVVGTGAPCPCPAVDYMRVITH